MSYNAQSIELESKGKMVLLYATVDGTREHVASFFHAHKADWVVDALSSHYEVNVGAAPKKTSAKKAVSPLTKKKLARK